MSETKIFTVERLGLFRWQVRARWTYGSLFVASFWRYKSAVDLAYRLNALWGELPERFRMAQEYGVSVLKAVYPVWREGRG
jgi:hypothetical protein